MSQVERVREVVCA